MVYLLGLPGCYLLPPLESPLAIAPYSIFYLTAEGKAEGFAGRDENLSGEGLILAIDYRTGKTLWSHDLYARPSTGLLSTAGKLLLPAMLPVSCWRWTP